MKLRSEEMKIQQQFLSEDLPQLDNMDHQGLCVCI